jgi:dsRNA-specific ribonuclease
MLQERTQAELRFTPVYRLIDAAGPDHEKQFYIEVVVGDVVIGHGVGNSKRSAAQSAARAALKRLEEVGWPEEAQDVLLRRTDQDEAES